MDQRKIHGVWSSRWTFVLAATGSAVGLGNIWKFPYITGENGGGAFVLVYLACIAVIGIPVMLSEVLLGRMGRQSPINSMSYVAKQEGRSQAWTAIGWSGVLAGLFILAFYSVVAGWALNYVVETGSGKFAGADADHVGSIFTNFLGDHTRLIIFHTLFILMTTGVVSAGVTKGLGNAARVLMPLLFVMLLILLIYGMNEGAFGEAVDFMFSFRFDKLSWDAVLIAMGHAFFTLSLGMGSIMAYGAYMPDKTNVGQTVLTVGVLDTFIALVAGLVIFPIVFANGLAPGEGPGLMFVSLPVAFGAMPAGTLFGTIFFVLVVVAAWSSAVSLIEPGVAWVVEKKKVSRVKANIILGLVAWVGGLACIFSNDWLDPLVSKWNVYNVLDTLTSQFMLPLGGLFIAIFVGWFMRRESIERELNWNDSLMSKWLFVLRYISPILVVIVFVMTVYNKFFAG